jgi:hypothetical protein
LPALLRSELQVRAGEIGIMLASTTLYRSALEPEESDSFAMTNVDTNPTVAPRAVSRRLLLRQMVALPAASVLTSALAACGGRATPEENTAQPPVADAGVTRAETCAGEDALTAQEQNMRRALNYVEQATDERTCDACQFYTAAA